MNTNTNGSKVINMSRDREDQALALMPAKIRNWLLFDAPANFDVRDVMVALHKGMSEDDILHNMQCAARALTIKTYGMGHPSMPYIKNEFAKGRNPYNELKKAA